MGDSWVLGLVGGIFTGGATDILMFIDGIFGTSMVKEVLGPVFKWLGFEDEDIYTASVQAICIYDDDTLDATRKILHIEYVKDNTGSLVYAKHYSRTGDTQFGKYYRHAIWDYVDHLPDVNINTFSYDRAKLDNAVVNYSGNSHTMIVDSSVRAPTDDEWAKWYLQRTYGFNYEANAFKHSNGLWYRFVNTTYNSNANNINIRIAVIPTISVYDVTNDNRVVTSYNATQDLVTSTKTVVTTLTYELNGLLYTLATTSRTLPTERIYVPKDSEVSRLVITSEDKPDITQSSNITNITIASFNTSTNYFIVDYVIGDTGVHQLLLFDVNNNSYGISEPFAHTGTQSLYPILMLRNHTFNLNEYASNESHTISGGGGTTDTLYKPSCINEERYKSTKDLLYKIGVDLDQVLDKISENPDISNVFSAFFVVGVSPKETDPIVSRYLYEMLDEIIDSYPYGDGAVATYSCAFKEDPYNMVFSWEGGSNQILEGSIAPMMGDCTHKVTDEVWVTELYEVIEDLGYKVNISNDDGGLSRQTACKYTAYRRYCDWKGDVYKTEVIRPTKLTTVEQAMGYTVPIHGASEEDDEYSQFDTYYDNNNDNLIRVWTKNGNIWTRTNTEESIKKKAIIVKKQLTSNTYRDISIHGVKAVSVVYGGESSTVGHFSIGCELIVDSENLTIPLSVDVVSRFTLMEKTALLGKALHLVFYSVQHTHLDWYQTEAFGEFLQILMQCVSMVITVVVTVFTWGTGTWAGMTLTQVLTKLFTMALIAAGTFVALELIGQLVSDPMLKAALSLAVMVVAAFASAGIGGGEMFNSTTAVELAGICVKAADIYVKSSLEQTQAKLGSLQNRYSEFMQQYEDRLNALEEATGDSTGQIATMDLALLTQGNIQDISTSNGIDESLNLSPGSFFYIATNQAAYDYDLLYTGIYNNTVHNFVANKLTLGLV